MLARSATYFVDNDHIGKLDLVNHQVADGSLIFRSFNLRLKAFV